MLFWVTVISFLVGIMTFMIYPREDQIETVHLPASEAYIAGFVTQHQAAKDYLREGLVALQRLPDYATDEAQSGAVLSLSGEGDNGESPLVEFLLPTQSIMTTKNFQPTSNDGFVSVLGCFSRPERKVSGNYVSAGLQPCTASSAQTKYVFTYGPLPDFFDDPYMRNKTLLWEAAILRRTHGSPDCGFLQKNQVRVLDESTGKVKVEDAYFVNNSSHLTRKIPSKFAEFLGSYIGQTMNDCSGYASHGRVGGDRIIVDGCSAPLLFCMTPANDPYPQAELIINYDSKINTGEPGNHAESLNDLPQESGNPIWTNLGRGTGGSTIQNGQISTSGSASWHDTDECSCESLKGTNCSELESTDAVNECYTCKQVCINPSLTIDGRVIDTGIKPKEFGNSFTISFLAKLDNESTSRYAVFGTSSCTPSINHPCLRAWVEDSKIHFELKESNTKKSEISGQVFDSVSQYDYILNQGSHKLYVNGQLVSGDIPAFGTTGQISEVSNLNGNNFRIGSDSTIAQNMRGELYNFLVYKRSMTTDDAVTGEQGTTAAEHFDASGLARIYKTNEKRYGGF